MHTGAPRLAVLCSLPRAASQNASYFNGCILVLGVMSHRRLGAEHRAWSLLLLGHP